MQIYLLNIINVSACVLRTLLLSSLIFAIAACGGGGGSSSNGGNSSSSSGGGDGGVGTFTLNQSNLVISADQRETSGPIAELGGSIVGVNQSVFIVIIITDNGLQSAEFQLDSNTSGTLLVQAKPPGMLEPGTYNDTITVSACLDAECNNHVGGSPKTVSVSYEVTDNFDISREVLSLSAVAGSSENELNDYIQVYGNSSDWTASVSESWLTVTDSAGAGPGQVMVGVNTTGLPPGTHETSIMFQDANSATNISLPVVLELSAPAFTVAPEVNLDFYGETTNDFVPVNISVTVGTGATSHPWQLIDPPDWVVASKISGSASEVADQFTLTVDPASLTGTGYNASLLFSADVNGGEITANVPVQLELEPLRLQAKKHGVAFTVINGIQKTEESIAVYLNRDLVAEWETWVSYDNPAENWLSVTANGTTGEAMALSVDATGLADNEVYYATVTLSSNNVDVVNSGQESVRVGLYVDSTLTPALSATQTLPEATFTAGIVADPVRPYVYVSHQTANIDVYNIHSGLLENTFVTGADLRTLTINDDGSTLYAMDFGNQNIVRVDLESGNILNALQPSGFTNCGGCSNDSRQAALSFSRINGQPVLITGAPQIIDAGTGEILAGQDILFPANSILAVSGNGKNAYSAGTVGAPHSVQRHRLRYRSSLEQFSIEKDNYEVSSTAYARGLSANYTGSAVYRACWYPNEFEAFNGLTMTSISMIDSGTNGGAILLDDNQLLCARYYDVFDESSDLWVIDLSDNSLLNEYDVDGTILEKQFTISGDGLRFISRSGNGDILTLMTR